MIATCPYYVCWWCGEDCTEDPCWLPTIDGRLVPLDWKGKWQPVPACAGCRDEHAAGLLPCWTECVETIWGTIPVG